jgi:uncharacterized membrane protein YeiH
MQYFLEHLATCVSAISGVLAARGKSVDLFGVVVLALVTSLGGGTVRDTILDLRPVFWVADSSYVVTATLCAMVTFFVARYWTGLTPLADWALQLADAASLALFTLVGTEKAMGAGVPPLVGMAMGVITGTAGGMIRDTLLGEIPMVFRRQIYLYATASLAGAGVFVALNGLVDSNLLRFLVLLTVFGLRLAAIWWKIHLPAFEPSVNIHQG